MLNLITSLSFHLDPPHQQTLMAHDQMIYWAYDKKRKISQEFFMIAREIGDLEALATVKFSSIEPILREVKKSDKDGETIKAEEKTADIYVIITSDPRSSL